MNYGAARAIRSYHTPQALWQLWNRDRVAFLFAAIDKTLFTVDGWFPILRSYTTQKCLDWILEHQEATGEWQAYFPPIHFSILALLLEGYSLKDDRIVFWLRSNRATRMARRERETIPSLLFAGLGYSFNGHSNLRLWSPLEFCVSVKSSRLAQIEAGVWPCWRLASV